MLKIESVSHKRDVTIRLRSTETLFTKHLWWALSISLGLHLLCALVVEIKSSAPSEWAPVRTIAVDTDLGLVAEAEESRIVPQMMDQGLMTRYVLEPEAAYPELAHMPARPVNRRTEADRDALPVASQFEDLERLPYVPDTPNFSFIRHFEPVRVNISGELAELTITDDATDLFAENVERPPLIKRCKARFHVQIDGNKGSVFWFETLDSSSNPELDTIAQRILTQLRFAPTPHKHICEGQIEVQFQVRETGPYDYLLGDIEATVEDELDDA